MLRARLGLWPVLMHLNRELGFVAGLFGVEVAFVAKLLAVLIHRNLA